MKLGFPLVWFQIHKLWILVGPFHHFADQMAYLFFVLCSPWYWIVSSQIVCWSSSFCLVTLNKRPRMTELPGRDWRWKWSRLESIFAVSGNFLLVFGPPKVQSQMSLSKVFVCLFDKSLFVYILCLWVSCHLRVVDMSSSWLSFCENVVDVVCKTDNQSPS